MTSSSLDRNGSVAAMSANSSVFVAYECTLERIVELLQPVIGQRLEQVNEAEGRLFKKSAMGIEISARDQHGLEDDVGIEFSRYPIQISFTRYAGTPEVDLL